MRSPSRRLKLMHRTIEFEGFARQQHELRDQAEMKQDEQNRRELEKLYLLNFDAENRQRHRRREQQITMRNAGHGDQQIGHDPQRRSASPYGPYRLID